MRFAAQAAFVFILLASIEYYPVALGKIPIPIYKINAFSVYDSVSAGLERGLNGAEIGDLVTQFYPWRDYAARSIRQGVIPLWNPYILGGTPFESASSGIFYPLNVPFYILPLDWAWSFMMVSQLILAGVFAALYVRSIGAGGSGAILAGIVFAFCGFMTSWRGFQIEDAALWLPLILLCTDHLREELSYRRLATTAAALSMPLLSGHPETAVHVYIVAGVYAL